MISVFRFKFHGRPECFSLLTRWPDLNWFSLRQHLFNSASHFQSIGSPAKQHEGTESKKGLTKRLQR
jgi:hypothetical protein